MALLREHFRFGVIAGGLVYGVVFAFAFYAGLFSDFHTLLVSFILGFIALVVGSLLPDMDAPRPSIHDTLLVFFGSLITIIMQRFGFTPVALLTAPLLSVWIDRNYLPPHRGFIHTVRAGVIFGILLSAVLYAFLIKNLFLCMWSGFCLALGHLVHLAKDKWIRF